MGACESRNHDDAEDLLIARLKSGDREAREEVARRHWGPMLACAKRILRRQEDCADAVQSAFVSAFSSIGEFAGESRVGTWLHRIVVNECLMRLRSEKRKTRISYEMSETISELCDRRDDRRAPDPVDRLAEAEAQAWVRLRVDQLHEPYRIVVQLRDLEELDTQETADRLGVSAAVIKTRLHRARRALRELLEPEAA